jgi:hypothetical protein
MHLHLGLELFPKIRLPPPEFSPTFSRELQ